MPSTGKLLLDAATADQIRLLFDQLLIFMGDKYTNSNVYAAVDVSGTNCGINATDTLGNTFTYTERITGPRIAMSPASTNLGPGETQQFTATVTDAAGVPIAGATVAWTLSDTALGGVDAAGLYTAPATIAAADQNFLTATYVEGGSKATATIALHV